MELKQRQRRFARGLLLIAVPAAVLVTARLAIPLGGAPSRGLAIFWLVLSLGTVFAGIVGLVSLGESRAGTLANPLALGAVFFSVLGVFLCALAAALALLSLGALLQPGGRLFGGN